MEALSDERGAGGHLSRSAAGMHARVRGDDVEEGGGADADGTQRGAHGRLVQGVRQRGGDLCSLERPAEGTQRYKPS